MGINKRLKFMAINNKGWKGNDKCKLEDILMKCLKKCCNRGSSIEWTIKQEFY